MMLGYPEYCCRYRFVECDFEKVIAKHLIVDTAKKYQINTLEYLLLKTILQLIPHESQILDSAN